MSHATNSIITSFTELAARQYRASRRRFREAFCRAAPEPRTPHTGGSQPRYAPVASVYTASVSSSRLLRDSSLLGIFTATAAATYAGRCVFFAALSFSASRATGRY